MKSLILVILQFGLILLLLAGTKERNNPELSATFLCISVLLMIWAVAAMKKSRLRIMPDPHRDALLITAGPYRYIRHPMYTAVLLACIGLLCAHFSFLRFCYWAALSLVLVMKMMYEEKMLSKKFEQYTAYSKNTYRILPYIF